MARRRVEEKHLSSGRSISDPGSWLIPKVGLHIKSHIKQGDSFFLFFLPATPTKRMLPEFSRRSFAGHSAVPGPERPSGLHGVAGVLPSGAVHAADGTATHSAMLPDSG